MPRRSELHSPLRHQPKTWLGEAREPRSRRTEPDAKVRGTPKEPEGHRPEERWAPTQGLAFRFLTRYMFNTGQLLAQWGT